jgi:anti-sigma factor RsiW
LSETLNHPTPDRLEALVEDTLDRADRAVVESHLATCERCQVEVADLRSLFEALASLPEVTPSVGFADRVMKGVRVRRPLLDRVVEWIERLAPDTNRGWAIATAVVAMPVLVSSALVWWLLSHPEVSAQRLWLVASALVGDAMSAGWQWAWASFAGSGLAAWANGLLEIAASLGHGGLALAALMFTTLTVGSVYVLYQNLFRANGRRAQHASYSF